MVIVLYSFDFRFTFLPSLPQKQERFPNTTLNIEINAYLCNLVLLEGTHGLLAERLGSGLQNRIPRFESGRDLR